MAPTLQHINLEKGSAETRRHRRCMVAGESKKDGVPRFGLTFCVKVKKRLLFVGENQPLWEEFHNCASSPNSVWATEFARTAAEALAATDQSSFDAVVADVALPDKNGVELLDKIMSRRPEALRIALSDIADSQGTLKCIGKAHHHLLKPCDASTIIHALNQALALEAWLPSNAVQSLIAQMRWLPSPPAIYSQLLLETQSPEASVERIGELIAQDPAVTAKMLQLANSAVFGLQLHVAEPVEAVAYIGLETTKALVLLAHTFSSFEKLHADGFSAESLWSHSMFTGQYARRIAQVERSGGEICELAFAAGLLHDIGKLLFAANLTKSFGQVLALARLQQRSLWEAESQMFGASHAEVGACALGIWGLPMPIIQAVALHHCPERSLSQEFSPLTAVHAANVLDHESRSDTSAAGQVEMEIGYLQELGLDDHIETWRSTCLAADEAFA